MRFCGSYQHSGSVNCSVKLHASTSQFLLDSDYTVAVQQHYECIVAIASKIFIG